MILGMRFDLFHVPDCLGQLRREVVAQAQRLVGFDGEPVALSVVVELDLRADLPGGFRQPFGSRGGELALVSGQNVGVGGCFCVHRNPHSAVRR